ncbi:MAG TPA: Crp/Fnr family transcriptional regulator [Clostridia bacterium]|nr:Crp/Fnr family transcriptional regulator [Clostridia bacterium]
MTHEPQSPTELPVNESLFRTTPELETALRALVSPQIALQGETIFAQGGSAKGVYLLMEGAAQLSMLSDGGREISNRVVGPGALLGLPATLCSKPYIFSAKAIQQSLFGFIEQPRLLDFLRTRPDLCLVVVQMMSQELSEANNARTRLSQCTNPGCVLAGACAHQVS